MNEDELKRLQGSMQKINRTRAQAMNHYKFKQIPVSSRGYLEFLKKVAKINSINLSKMGEDSFAIENRKIMQQISASKQQIMVATSRKQKGINFLTEAVNSEYWKSIHSMAQRAGKVADNFKKEYPNQRKVIDKIYQTGWSMGNGIENFPNLFTQPDDLLKFSLDEIDQQYSSYYIKNNGIFDELENIQSSVTIHKDIVQDLITTLKESPNSWKLFYPLLFSILDAILVSQRHEGKLNVDDFSNHGRVEKMKKRSKSDKKIEVDIFQYVYYKTLEQADILFKNKPFKLPSEQVEFGRNSIQHGRYDPSNYTYKQFAQLVVFISTLCIYNK